MINECSLSLTNQSMENQYTFPNKLPRLQKSISSVCAEQSNNTMCWVDLE